MGDTLTFKPKDGTCLATSRNLKLGFALQRRHFYLSTEGSLSKVDWQLVEDIITISGEKVMLFN